MPNWNESMKKAMGEKSSPYAEHLPSVLVDKGGDGIGGPDIFIDAIMLVVPPLQLACCRT
jgi:hypothetical protein